MKKPQDHLDLIYQNYIDLLTQVENDPFTTQFYKALKSGSNTVYQKNMSESKAFDETWIKTIESYFPSLDKITKNPKSSLKYDEEIVAIEKAKKVSSQSIRHLASHTHMIKEVRSDGSVMPKKIMVQESDIDYGIYENRFIMTLIERLFHFVRSRLDTIKENFDSYEKKHFNYQSAFMLNQTDVDLSIDVTLKDELDNPELNEYNKKLLKRVEHLDKLVASLRGSQFMQLMEGQKKVIPPIIKTQIILKNVDFRNAYMLWLFLDRYNLVAYDVTVKEKDLTFDKAYLKDVERLAMTSFMTITANQNKRKELYDEIELKAYRKKHFNVSTKHIDDVIEEPSGIELEDTNLNQYYLEQNKKLFKKDLDEQLEKSSTYEVGLKRAIRDLINITNGVYESHFQLDNETDVFRQLVKNDDPEVLLKELKEKQRIARIIRETKEVDYNNAIRLERSLLKEIEKNDQRLISSLSKRQEKSINEQKELERLKIEKQIAKENDKLLAESLKYTSKMKEELQKERQQTEELLKKSVEERNHLENVKLLAEKEKLDKSYEEKLARLTAKFELEKKQQSQEVEKQIKAFKKEQADKLKEEKKKIKAYYMAELKQIKEEKRQKEAHLKVKLRAQHENNQVKLESKFEKLKERTLHKLEAEKTAYENVLKLKNQKEKEK
jgi:hypothetical protein